jgi:hypothetical protein
LAEVVPFPEPPVSWAAHVHLSKRAQFVLYHGLDKKTHVTYKSYQRSYEDYCYGEGIQNPYPATPERLVEWVALRTEGSVEKGQSPIKAESILQCLSAIRAIHVARFLPTIAFDNPAVKLAIAGARRLQGKREKTKAEPLSKEQLRHITSPAPEIDSDNESDVDHDEPPPCNLSNSEVNNLNFDAAIKLAFEGFLRTAELTCEPKDLENRPVFEHTKLQRRDVTFADNDEHAVILLRSSKSDYDHTGVEIVVANTGEDTCPVAALRALYTLDPQPPRAPLFRTHNGTLSRNKYINEMRRRLKDNGHTNYKCYSGHSPRRGAAQHAADNGILEYDIQRLGRWSSEAFKGYFHISQAYKFLLNCRFQTGRSVPVIQTSLNVPTGQDS